MCPPFGGQHGPAQAAAAGGGMFLISWRIVSEKLDPYWRDDSEKRQIPDLVKLDVQGFELEALKGATQLFGRTEVFIMETPVFHEVVQFMADRGYLTYDFPGFLRRPRDGALGQCGVCFVRENSPLRESS